MTDFENLKIKSARYFRDAYWGRMYVCVFIVMITHTYINIYIYIVFLKKKYPLAPFTN
jgi:hypothetical protein